MTTSTGKTLKLKHDDDAYADEDIEAEKKQATEKLLNDKPEVTITLSKE